MARSGERGLRAATAGLGLQDVEAADEGRRRLATDSRYYSGKVPPPITMGSEERKDIIGGFKVEPIGPNSLLASWTWRSPELRKNVKITNIYYFPQGSSDHNSRVHMSPDVSNRLGLSYTLRKAPEDTQYRVCIRVQKGGSMASEPDDIVCRDSTPQPWHMPASIGSSVGALLALIVVILVMVSLQRKRRHRRLNGGGPASKRSRIDSALESQFDSIAFREETSFYDDNTTIYDSTCGASGGESCLHSSCGANSAVLAGLNSQLSASSAGAASTGTGGGLSPENHLDNGAGGGGGGSGGPISGDASPTAPQGGGGLDAPALAPLLGRQVSSGGTGKSVTFKEERKARRGGANTEEPVKANPPPLLQRADSDESRDTEPASVVMETVIDVSPAVMAPAGPGEEKESGSGIYTQLIETI